MTDALRLLGFGLLPVLERLRSGLNAFEVWIHAAGRARSACLLRGDFLPPGLFFSTTFLALALTLALLL